jgi:hypothetical protein
MALIELEAVTVFRLKQHLDGHPWPSLPEDVRLAYGELEAALGDFVCQDCGVLLHDPASALCGSCAKASA